MNKLVLASVLLGALAGGIATIPSEVIASAANSVVAGGAGALKLTGGTMTGSLVIATDTDPLTLGSSGNTLVFDIVPNDATVGDYIRISGGGGYVAASAGLAAGCATGATCDAGVVNAGFQMKSGGGLRWTGNATNGLGVGADTIISRNAAGIVQVGTTANNASGELMFDIAESSIGAGVTTCTQGQWKIDTGVTVELCYCRATNTLVCTTMTAGPAD